MIRFCYASNDFFYLEKLIEWQNSRKAYNKQTLVDFRRQLMHEQLVNDLTETETQYRNYAIHIVNYYLNRSAVYQ